MALATLSARAAAVAAVAVVAAALAPYAILGATSLSTYYGVTAVGPPLLALFAAAAAVAFAAAAADRTDAQLVAGVGLVFGLVVAGGALWWAVAAGDVVGGIPIGADFAYHRWLLAGAAVVYLLAAVTYAYDVV